MTSVPALLTALADNAVTEIVVANGTYRVSGAVDRAGQLALDRRPVRGPDPPRPRPRRDDRRGDLRRRRGLPRRLSFEDGAHHQTWQGFRFANGAADWRRASSCSAATPARRPHHITLRDISVTGLISSDGLRHGYPIYFSMAAAPGPHDLLIENFTAIDNGALKALIHFYHDTAAGDPAGNFNCQNVVIRNAHLTGTPQPVMIWARSLTNLLIEDSTITGAGETAIRYEYGSGVVFRRVVSTGSAQGGFYSSLGPNPPGVTFDTVSLR